jgi:hypothetical protein
MSNFPSKHYAEVIWLPHPKAKFRKLKISYRLLFSMFSVLLSTLLLGAVSTASYFGTLVRDKPPAKSLQMEREIGLASAQMLASMKKLETITSQLLTEQHERESQLRETEKRYQELRALAAGQEKIAEAHRAILVRRSTTERIVDISVSFVVGVLASLVATLLWYLRSSEPISAAEVSRMESNQPRTRE